MAKCLEWINVLKAKSLVDKMSVFMGWKNVVGSRMFGGKMLSVAKCLSGKMLLVLQC